MKKKLVYVGILVLCLLVTVGVSYAAFSDKGSYKGATFSVGSSDLKLLNDVSLGAGENNLVDEKEGPTFNNISPGWTSDYGIKLLNNSTDNLTMVSNANYETALDPAELRQYIYVDILDWNDTDGDGIVDEGEASNSRGLKTLVKWKTEGIEIGQINTGDVKGFVLRFSTTSSFPTSKQGATGQFDFEFNATGIN